MAPSINANLNTANAIGLILVLHKLNAASGIDVNTSMRLTNILQLLLATQYIGLEHLDLESMNQGPFYFRNRIEVIFVVVYLFIIHYK